jgi:hypothetical protein
MSRRQIGTCPVPSTATSAQCARRQRPDWRLQPILLNLNPVSSINSSLILWRDWRLLRILRHLNPVSSINSSLILWRDWRLLRILRHLNPVSSVNSSLILCYVAEAGLEAAVNPTPEHSMFSLKAALQSCAMGKRPD